MLALAACQAVAELPASLLQPTAAPGAPSPAPLSGSLEATQINLASEVTAPIAAIEADEGQPVRAGQSLVRLDDTLARARVDQARAALDAAQAAQAEASAGPRPDAVAAAQASVARAQADAIGARQAVSDTRAVLAQAPGLAAQIAQAQAQAKIAQQSVERATADRAESETLRDAARVGTPDRDVQEKRLAAAQANLAAAQAELAGAQAYLEELERVRRAPVDLTVNAHAAESQARVAEAALQAAQAALDLAQAPATAEDLAIAESQAGIASARLALAEAGLAKYVLVSPIDGTLTRKVAQAGEIARAGSPLLIVSDLRVMKLKLYVPVSRIGSVRVGQAVDVTVPAYPGQPFRGAVARIAAEAEFTPSTVQTADERAGLVFAVTVELPNPDGRLKAGMPADGAFVD
jgi:HlyD family secretion protein